MELNTGDLGSPIPALLQHSPGQACLPVPPDGAGAQPVADQDLTLMLCFQQVLQVLACIACEAPVVSGTEIQSDSLDRGWR